MRLQAHIPATLVSTSQARGGTNPFTVAASSLVPCISPSSPSPNDRSFARRGMGNDASHRKLRSTHSLLLQPWNKQTTEREPLLSGCDGVLIYRYPSGKCFRKAPYLPYFPCLPLGHSLRCLSRAPRHSTFCFGCAALRVWVSKQKISLRLRPKVWARFFLRSLHRKTRLRHLGAGHLASLRAGVSRGQSGQIQTGEMTWHSTKTKSL